MLRAKRHDGEDPINPLNRHLFMEQIAVRADKYLARSLPVQWISERIRYNPHRAVEMPIAFAVENSQADVVRFPPWVAALLDVGLCHRLLPVAHRHGVAVVAAC
jgi:hypothetical protein